MCARAWGGRWHGRPRSGFVGSSSRDTHRHQQHGTWLGNAHPQYGCEEWSRARLILAYVEGQAKKNACINGAAVQQASRIAHLDWADPPTLSRSALGTTETWPAETNDETTQNKASSQSCSPDEIALLEGKVDLLIAADIINCEGLSDLVYRCAASSLTQSLFQRCPPLTGSQKLI